MAEHTNRGNSLTLRPSEHNSHLCQICRNMDISNLETGFNHYPSYGKLQVSAKSCPLCSLILDCLHEDGSQDFQSRQYKELNLNGDVLIQFDYCERRPFSRPRVKEYSELVRIQTNNLKGYLRIYAHKGTHLFTIIK